MFHDREGLVEVVQQRPPCLVLFGLPEAHGVVFELFPFNEE